MRLASPTVKATTPRTAVVHLVRHSNGLGPFERFAASYARHSAGSEHDLVLLFKGIADPRDRDAYLERLVPSRWLDVPDTGFDIGAYRVAARALPHERICLLNSFSEILRPGWLAHLESGLESGAGAAGATGSWASRAGYQRYLAGLPSPYARALPGRRSAYETLNRVTGTRSRPVVPAWLESTAKAAALAPTMPGFPAAHLRTNCFLIERARFASLETGALTSKRAAHRFEAGRRSMSRQLVARGCPPVTVDARGTVRERGDWPAGDVFWQADQADLLVADNQTRRYAQASREERGVLSAYAWGTSARPALTATADPRRPRP